MSSVWFAMRFVSGSSPRRRSSKARQHAPHVGKRLFHSRNRMIDIDLVFEIDIAEILHGLELSKELGDGDLALADDALALLVPEVAKILGMHVEEAGARVGRGTEGVGSSANRVADVHAQPHSPIHPLHRLQHVVWRREVLILGAMIVDCKLDVVLLDELLDAGQRAGLGRSYYHRHARSLRIVEVLPYALVGVGLEGDHASANNLESGSLNLSPRATDLHGCGLVRKVHRFEVDVRRAERLRHLTRLLAREIPERVAGDAPLQD